MLSTRLQTLVEAGVLERRADPGHAGRHLYELTDAGKALWPAVYTLRAWGERFAAGDGGPSRVFTHDQCGRPLDEVARCGTCGCVPRPENVIVSPVSKPGPHSRTAPVALGLLRPHRLLDALPGDDG